MAGHTTKESRILTRKVAVLVLQYRCEVRSLVIRMMDQDSLKLHSVSQLQIKLFLS